MKTYVVRFMPRAERQLVDLYEYIVHASGEKRAERYVSKITAACNALSIFPERGSKRDDLRPGLRTMGFRRTATIAFSVDVELGVVVIHGVFFGGQDFETLWRETNSDD